jgi:hypothetical protein
MEFDWNGTRRYSMKWKGGWWIMNMNRIIKGPDLGLSVTKPRVSYSFGALYRVAVDKVIYNGSKIVVGRGQIDVLICRMILVYQESIHLHSINSLRERCSEHIFYIYQPVRHFLE